MIGLRRGFDTLTVPAFDAGATTAPANAACAVGGDTLLISEVR